MPVQRQRKISVQPVRAFAPGGVGRAAPPRQRVKTPPVALAADAPAGAVALGVERQPRTGLARRRFSLCQPQPGRADITVQRQRDRRALAVQRLAGELALQAEMGLEAACRGNPTVGRGQTTRRQLDRAGHTQRRRAAVQSRRQQVGQLQAQVQLFALPTAAAAGLAGRASGITQRQREMFKLQAVPMLRVHRHLQRQLAQRHPAFVIATGQGIGNLGADLGRAVEALRAHQRLAAEEGVRQARPQRRQVQRLGGQVQVAEWPVGKGQDGGLGVQGCRRGRCRPRGYRLALQIGLDLQFVQRALGAELGGPGQLAC